MDKILNGFKVVGRVLALAAVLGLAWSLSNVQKLFHGRGHTPLSTLFLPDKANADYPVGPGPSPEGPGGPAGPGGPSPSGY